MSRITEGKVVIFSAPSGAGKSTIIGRLLDRVSVRKLMMASSLLFAGSMAIISQSHSLALDAALIAAPVAETGPAVDAAPIG